MVISMVGDGLPVGRHVIDLGLVGGDLSGNRRLVVLGRSLILISSVSAPFHPRGTRKVERGRNGIFFAHFPSTFDPRISLSHVKEL